jgi:type I restriction enzyme M protein
LSESFAQNFPEEAKNYFDLILSAPPILGTFDKNEIAHELTRKVKSTNKELLFIVRILKMLKEGGRCAVIVPDSVLYRTSLAHMALRQLLVEENKLEGVISLPTNVYKPYSEIRTAILLFTKGGETHDIFYFEVQANEFSLDKKRKKIENNNLATLLRRWKDRDPTKDQNRTDQAFFIPAAEIRAQKYDLSLTRYKEQIYIPEKNTPP